MSEQGDYDFVAVPEGEESAAPDYFLDNYGSCAYPGVCKCLRDRVWFGRACAHWVPWGVVDHASLKSKVYAETGVHCD